MSFFSFIDRAIDALTRSFAGPLWRSKSLLVIDAKSKFPMVIDMQDNTTASHVSQALDLVSDNGLPFTSYHIQQFYRHDGTVSSRQQRHC